MQSRHLYEMIWAIIAVSSISTLGLTDSAIDSAREIMGGNKPLVIGPKLRAGGRFDNVRMCVASPAGAKGGPAADLSLSVEIALRDTVGIEIDLPVFRPILFGAAFQMLQFEPSVTLRFRKIGARRTDLIGGPMIGVSLHYGPDYKSEASGDGRASSFFAMGPILGGYVGVDFKRPCKPYNFQLGISPYVEPLFGINDPENHRGVVVGGLFDFQFRFGRPRPAL